MPVDPEYIEQLVLEEITGIISPEDSATLKRLLEQEPEAYAIWQRMHQQLTGTYIKSVREDLPDTLPLSQIISAARKRKRRQVLRKVAWSMAACVAVLALVYKLIIPVFQPVSPGPIPSFALKSVAMQLPDGHYVRLGSGQQQEIDGIIFREEAGKLSWSGGGNSSQLVTLIVPPGKDYSVRLPDGSDVSLNAATTMRLPLAFGKTRDITVNGEAYFTVVKDETKPFRVQLPRSVVQVLGTAFNVNTYDSGQVKVSLAEGAVKMLTADGALVLAPGEAVDYRPGAKPLASEFDAATVLSWRLGYYLFDKTPMSVISPIIARNYNIRVVLDSKETANKRYSSRLEKGMTLEKFLARLKEIEHIDHTYEEGDSVLHLLYRP